MSAEHGGTPFGASDLVLRVAGQIWSNFSRFGPCKRSGLMRGSRGGGQGGGPVPLKNHNATRPTFNVGSSSARQRNAISIVEVGPPMTKLSGSAHGT